MVASTPQLSTLSPLIAPLEWGEEAPEVWVDETTVGASCMRVSYRFGHHKEPKGSRKPTAEGH